MATRHWKIHVKGDPTADEIHRAVGGGGGLITRIHRDRGETHVYFTADEPGKDLHAALRGAEAAREVKADEVTRF